MGKSRPIRVDLKPPKTITEKETEKLLTQLRVYQGTPLQVRRGLRNQMMAIVMLEAGLRVAELTHLEVGDLWYGDEPVENLVVRSAIAKRNEERTIPVSVKLATGIRDIQSKHWALDGCNYTAYAFYMNKPNEKLTTRSVERIIKAAAALSFRKIVTPHTLRHTFATRILAKSNTRIVQTLLGHKCLSTTQRYLHPSADTLKAAIDAAQ